MRGNKRPILSVPRDNPIARPGAGARLRPMTQGTAKIPGTEPGLPAGGKARAVCLALRDAIARGVYSEGSVLPGEQRLAALHGVSRVTIRRALAALAESGAVVRQVGRGSVVRPLAPQPGALRGDAMTLLPQLSEMADRTEVRLLSFTYGAATADVAAALGLSPGGRVQTAVRVRSIDGRPFSHLTTHVPEAIAASYTEADLATTPLFRLLERGGRRIDAAEQTVTAAPALPSVAEALGVEPGAALLGIARVVRDADGLGVEFLSALYRPDLFHLSMHLNRVGAQDERHWAPVIAPLPTGRQAAE